MRKLHMEVLWLIVLILLLITMGSLLISGNIVIYLAPRMIPMVWFGFIILIVLFFHQFYNIVNNVQELKKDSVIKIYNFFYLIPILIYISVTPNTNTAQNLPNQNLNLSKATLAEQVVEESSKTAEDLSIKSDANIENDIEPTSTPAAITEREQAVEGTKETTENMQIESDANIENEEMKMSPCIIVEGEYAETQDRFLEYMDLATEELVGKSVTIYGFVYKDDSCPSNIILLSRLMISCCVADAALIGYPVLVEDANSFLNDEWIQVTGVMDEIELEMYGQYYQFPILTNGTIIRCEAPPMEDAYIYP